MTLEACSTGWLIKSLNQAWVGVSHTGIQLGLTLYDTQGYTIWTGNSLLSYAEANNSSYDIYLPSIATYTSTQIEAIGFTSVHPKHGTSQNASGITVTTSSSGSSSSNVFSYNTGTSKWVASSPVLSDTIIKINLQLCT